MNTKHSLFALLMIGLIAQGCKKDRPQIEPIIEEPKTIIPEKPAEEDKDPGTGHPPSNNGGIIHAMVEKELSYNKFITLDINGDKKNDLYFSSVLVQDSKSHLYLFASPTSTSGGKLFLDRSVPMAINGNWAQPIKKGEQISTAPTQNPQWINYMTKGILLDVIENPTGRELAGPWIGQQERYLGLQLLIGGKTHYGWIRIAHKQKEEKITIAEYAYNTIASQQIRAGQTSN